jgi:hypothetical protein
MVVAQLNQTYVNARHDDTLEMLAAEFLTARQDTLDLLHQFTDGQLTASVRTPIGGEIAGDLFARRAEHAVEHITSVEEGLQNRGHSSPGLEPGDEWPFWLAATVEE